jgi:hypothetical protein
MVGEMHNLRAFVSVHKPILFVLANVQVFTLQSLFEHPVCPEILGVGDVLHLWEVGPIFLVVHVRGDDTIAATEHRPANLLWFCPYVQERAFDPTPIVFHTHVRYRDSQTLEGGLHVADRLALCGSIDHFDDCRVDARHVQLPLNIAIDLQLPGGFRFHRIFADVEGVPNG